MTHSENISELAKALNSVQKVLEGAKKDSANPHLRSKYASLSSVWDAVREPLAENGLSVIQTTGSNESGHPVITTMLLHNSGQWVRDSLTIKPVKDSPQDIGGAITYGRRYGLSAIVGVSPEDDDGETAVGRGARMATADVASKFQSAATKPAPGNIVRPVAVPSTVKTV